MGQSIIYSSVLSCVLASMSAVKTSAAAFDTRIMDLTPLCADPVDLLFGFQMGGSADIAKSTAYCQELIEAPAKTNVINLRNLSSKTHLQKFRKFINFR